MSMKIPARYPIPKELGPYEILGLKQNASLPEISKVYKTLVLALHPDKALSSEAKKLGWTVEDKNHAFEQVHRAYKEILSTKQERNVPDYDMKYDVGNEFDKNPDLVRMDFTKIDTEPGKFDQSRFNQFFETDKKKHEANGFADPWSQGYESMFRTREENDPKNLTNSRREDLPVSKPSFKQHAELHNGQLISKPKEIISSHVAGQYEQLGLTKVDNFSVTLKCKPGDSGLCGTDLSEVYAHDYGYWENTFRNDKNLSKKFNDTMQPEKKMNMHLTERSNFNFKDIDPEITLRMKMEAEQVAKMDDLHRMRQQKQIDDYYHKVSQSRIKL
jgi:curved DNA-binding protein CbpA